MKYKNGVVLSRVIKGSEVFMQPIMCVALDAVENAYRKKGIEPTVTSVIDGKHMKGSKHYEGLAIDIRIKDLPGFWLFKRAAVNSVVDELKKRLEHLGFQVILEFDKYHVHIEWDPK